MPVLRRNRGVPEPGNILLADNNTSKMPPELVARVDACMREDANGEYNIIDMPTLIGLVMEHGKQFPALRNLLQLNKDAVIEHFHQTGEGVPGVKITLVSTEEGSNVTALRVHYGKAPAP